MSVLWRRGARDRAGRMGRRGLEVNSTETGPIRSIKDSEKGRLTVMINAAGAWSIIGWRTWASLAGTGLPFGGMSAPGWVKGVKVDGVIRSI